MYCVPGQIVEAVSGRKAATTIPVETLRAVGYDVSAGEREGGMPEGIFESLVTRWTVRGVPAGGPRSRSGSANGSASAGGVGVERQGQEDNNNAWTEVSLSVQFRFANPALGFAVGQVADDMVDKMVQAFEDRARRLYGRKAP